MISESCLAPQVIEEYSPDRTILKLAFVKDIAEKKSAIKIGDKKSAITEERLRQIMESMEAGSEYRADQISEVVGLKASRMRQLLNMLVEDDKVEVTGKNRNRRYRKK